MSGKKVHPVNCRFAAISPKAKLFNRARKQKKLYTIFFPTILTVVFLALLFFIFWPAGSVPEHQINIFSENPKQGSTILIRVSNKYSAVSGFFNNENINFFKNGKYSDWNALLGIDAGLEPGKYKISVNPVRNEVSNGVGEKMEKEINVEANDFPSIKMIVTQELKNKGFTGKKIVENIKNNDNPALNQVLSEFTPLPYFDSQFSMPLRKIKESGLVFGQFIKGAGYNIQHFGVDLRAESGTKVYAVNAGKVVLVKSLLNYGNTAVIDHGLGIFSLYLHLDEFRVSPGQLVEKGQVIGLSGNSGYSTAPHLHFSIRDNGTRVDPISFIKTTEKTSENFNLASIKEALLKIFNTGILK